MTGDLPEWTKEKKYFFGAAKFENNVFPIHSSNRKLAF